MKKICLIAVNARYIHTNLAVRTIKNAIGDAAMVDIIETTINNNEQEILEQIYLKNPDCTGFSCYIWNIEMILKICSSLKQILPDCMIILGGPEVSYDCENVLNDNSFIDYIITGMGEIGMPQMVKVLDERADISSVEGLCYRAGKGICHNKIVSEYSLDKQSFPYNISQLTGDKILYYETSRGCPYRCSYCMSGQMKEMSFMSLDKVKAGLIEFIRNDVKQVKFVDRTFNYPIERAIRIIRDIAELKKRYSASRTRFHFEINPNIIDDEFYRAVETAGGDFLQFEIGIQSTFEPTLKAIFRSADIKKQLDNIKGLIKISNAKIYIDLIAGLPLEDYISFARSFNMVYRLDADVIHLGFLKVLNGSQMELDAKKYGIIYEEKPPYTVLKTDSISYEELNRLKRIEKCLDIYYNSGNFAKSIRYAVGLFKSPFDFYEGFSQHLSDGEYFGYKHKFSTHFDRLYEFLISVSDADKGYLKDCLIYDWVIAEKPRNYPDCIKDGYDKDIKRFRRDFFNDSGNIKRYMPEYMDRTPSTISRQCHIIRLENLEDRAMIILFDYQKQKKNRAIIIEDISEML